MNTPSCDPDEFARLVAENQRLRRIRDVLVRRVEQSMDSQGTAFALFEKAILLERQVKQRTAQLEDALRELQETNRQLVVAKEAADAGSRAKSAFLAMMSHEIRTPLNGILGLGEILAGTHLDRDQQGMLASLVHSAEMLLSLLDDVLDVSRIEAGKLELDPTVVELRPLLDHVRLLFDVACMQKGLRLCVRIADDVPAAVRIDGMRLRQVLVNLVGNAVKFTDNGEVTVEVARGVQPDEIVFGVRDTGIGIAKEAVGRLFVPFSQGDQSMARRYGGSGLGLSICKRLCTMLGGELGFESEAGRGALFRFSVRAPVEVLPPKEKAAEPLPRFCASVLVVDDNSINLRVATSLLERLGCKAIAASSGPLALELAAQHAFDLVLMDIQMPGMDGLETTRRLREAGLSLDVPIVALTANAMRGDEDRYLGAGMSGYLAKPVRIHELAGGLAQHLPASALAPT